jgi:predicted acyltransferase
MNNNTLNSVDAKRIESIDIFRGITIFAMIFVNDLTSVTNITFWLKHMPANESGMTIPDVVFPAFLFIVGMSIPLALKKRIDSGETNLQIIKHIFIRSAALIILGILMVNIGSLNEDLTGISQDMWSLLMYLSVILVWNIYPKNEAAKGKKYNILKLVGVISLIVLVLIYRGGTSENVTWIKTSWWGILGLIGWAYLASSIVYLFAKKNFTFLSVTVSLFIALYIGDRSGALDFLVFNKSFLLIGPHLAGHAVITTLGIILSLIFMEGGYLSSYSEKIKKSFIFAAVLFIAGFLLTPLYGISKIYTTPAFSLYSSAMCVLLFCIIYWMADIKKIKKWATIFKPAGSNPLLAYILPSIVYSIISILGLSSYTIFFRDGYPGIFRSVVFSFVIVALTSFLTKLKIKLQL